MLPPVAILGFAGVRRAEILRFTWKDVWKTKADDDSPDGYIEVPARKAKGGRERRLVPIQPALAEWLAPYAQAKGAVWAGSENQYHHAFDKLMNITNDLPGHNLLRHSYVSYRIAQTQNEHTVSFESGHTPAVLFKNYRKLVSPAQAKRWFSITPNEADNVIAANVG
jgi:integrase